MTSDLEPESGINGADGSPRRSRRAAVGAQFERLVVAIRDGDEAMVESTIQALSQRSRWLAPLALLVGAFAMLFQGVKLLFTNWRLTLVQILPAMWIWAAMLDLKAHVFHGKQFHVLRGPLLIPVVLVIASITAAAFFLNAVFAFSISRPGEPQIRPAFAQARQHKAAVLGWGFVIGLALGFSTMVVQRWGVRWFGLALGIVVGVLMFTYVLIPSRLLGVKSNRSRRDKLSASAIGGVIGAVVCSPPYFLGRVAILMLGSHTLRILAVVLLALAIVLQTGATSAVKAIKLSAKLAIGHSEHQAEPSLVPTSEGREPMPADSSTSANQAADPAGAVDEA
ncbi:MAG: hypothetical protein IVW52_15145 [Acidimicrobiales bacterium]|nr:hypothetical protein [Acidimicrobiales bacterium]